MRRREAPRTAALPETRAPHREGRRRAWRFAVFAREDTGGRATQANVDRPLQPLSDWSLGCLERLQMTLPASFSPVSPFLLPCLRFSLAKENRRVILGSDAGAKGSKRGAER